jgi:hypothetical protein
MLRTIGFFSSALFAACLTACAVSAQIGADMRDPFSRRTDDFPRGVNEKREQMRIDKEKKEYGEMLDRGEQTVRLAEQLARSYAVNGRFSEGDLSKLEVLEKNVKKIRNELGGDDDDEDLVEVLGKDKLSVADALNTLKDTTTTLLDELKKTSRFNISAVAIQSSNAAITIVHFLRFGK